MLPSLVFLQHQALLKKQSLVSLFAKPDNKKLYQCAKQQVMDKLRPGMEVTWKLGDNSTFVGLIDKLGDFSVFIDKQIINITQIILINYENSN